MKILNREENKWREYKKEILGSTCLHSNDDEYFEIAMAEKYNMLPSQWLNLDIADRARIVAYHITKSRVDVIDEHIRKQEEIEKSRDKKT